MSVRPTTSRSDPRLTSHPHRVVVDGPDFSSEPGEASVDYLRLLFTRWRLIVVLTLVGGAAAAGLSLMARRVYQAGVTLAVAAPKIGETEVRGERVKDFVTLLENQATALDTIHRFKLDEAPYNVGPEEFLLRSVRAEQIGNTNLIRLNVRLQDARLAADIANDMAVRARDLTQRLTGEEVNAIRATLATQLAESKQRLETAQNDLEKVKTEGQYDLLKRDVETLLGQRKDLRELNVKIAGERAWLARAETELGRRQRIDLLTRTIDADNQLREAARESGARSVVGLSTRNEFVNASYDELDGRVSKSRADLSGFEQQRDQLIRVSGLDKPALDRLSQLYVLETKVSRLEVDLELAKRVYLDVAIASEQARTQVPARSPTLQIVDTALVPTRAEPRYTTRNAAIGGLGGGLLAFLIILLPPMLAAPRRTADA